jgi:hypothetical protein
VTVDGQQFLPGEPRQAPLRGALLPRVRARVPPRALVSDDGGRSFLARDIDDAAAAGRRRRPAPPRRGTTTASGFGFLTPQPGDAGFTFDDRDEDYPETWLEFDAAGNPRSRATTAPRARGVPRRPDGRSGRCGGLVHPRAAFASACAAATRTARRARDRNRLASLSAEGRSSATTVLVGSVLRWMHGAELGLRRRHAQAPRLHRQPPGRGPPGGALQRLPLREPHPRGLPRRAQRPAGDGLAQRRARGSRSRRRSASTGPDPGAAGRVAARPGSRASTCRRPRARCARCSPTASGSTSGGAGATRTPTSSSWDWSTVDYLGLDELVADESLFANAPRPCCGSRLRRCASASIASSSTTCASGWRSAARCSTRRASSRWSPQKSHSFLRRPWGFGPTRSRAPRALAVRHPPPRKEASLRDEDLIVRGGSRSALGKSSTRPRSLRGVTSSGNPAGVRKLKSKDFDELIEALLAAAARTDSSSEEATPFGDKTGFRLNDACVLFKRRAPDVPDPANAPTPSSATTTPTSRRCCAGRRTRSSASRRASTPRRSTASGARCARSASASARRSEKELAADEKHLREIPRGNRFLPVLFCSPTMELGVDISALNAVYLRNVPPTPANYAQRSGRAGRSGQAALVLTYCSSQSPHDQYFFRDPRRWCTARCARRSSTSPTATSSRATSRPSGSPAPRSRSTRRSPSCSCSAMPSAP